MQQCGAVFTAIKTNANLIHSKQMQEITQNTNHFSNFTFYQQHDVIQLNKNTK